MTCIPLNGLNVPSAKLQLQRCTAVTQAVEYNRPQAIRFNKLVELLINNPLLIGTPIHLSHDQIIIMVLFMQEAFIL